MTWKRNIIAAVGIIVLLAGCTRKKPVDLNKIVQEGDLIFVVVENGPDRSIWNTPGVDIYTAGIILEHKKQFMVLSTNGRVEFTPLEDFIKWGKDGKFIIKRLFGSTGNIDRGIAAELMRAANDLVGLEYDYQLDISSKKIYNSELIWKMYRLGLLVELNNPEFLHEMDLSSDDAKKYIDKYLGGKIPRGQEVFTPWQIFSFEGLELVYQN